MVLTILLYGMVIMSKFSEGSVLPGGECKAVKPVRVDMNWVHKNSINGLVCPFGHKLGQGLGAPAPPPENTTLPHRECWKMDVNTPLGVFTVPYRCRYENWSQQTCSLDTQGTPVERVLKFFGDFTMVLSDNSTYLVMSSCLPGNKEFWIVVIPRGTNLGNQTESILAKIKAMGLSTEKKDMRSSDDKVSIAGARTTDCNTESGPSPVQMPATPAKPDTPALPGKDENEGGLGKLVEDIVRTITNIGKQEE